MINVIEKAELREGAIYRWRWADEKRDSDRGSWGSYHCCSCWAVVSGGHLVDTFWHGGDNKNLDPDDVVLTYVAHPDELVEIKSYDLPYYRRDDIVDMRHANNSSGPIYRRIDATRDAETMMENAEEKMRVARETMEAAQRDIQYAQMSIEHPSRWETGIHGGQRRWLQERSSSWQKI